MRIDAHQHFWRYHPERHAWITSEMAALRRDFLPEHLRPELAAAEIDSTVAVQTEQSEEETRFLLGLASRNPEIAGVVGWVDLCAESIEARLEYFSQFPKLKGFRHIVQSEPDNGFLVRDDFLRGIARLKEFHFTYDILIYPRQLPAAADLVARFPGQRFIVDHLAKPLIKSRGLDPWESWMRKIASRENVFCKVSGLVTEAEWRSWTAADFAPYLDVVFDAFGADRLIFGSDWPVCLVAATYLQVKNLIESYAGSDHDRIFGQNAARFYGLRA
jgi:L-fuconolactonase